MYVPFFRLDILDKFSNCKNPNQPTLFYLYPILSLISDVIQNLDNDYKIIKSTLDGSIQNQPTNIVLYVTSNRRHLMSREMIDNERSSAIHTDENVEEKISFSDRFGLWLGFHQLSQDEYLTIIKSYFNIIGCDFCSCIFFLF